MTRSFRAAATLRLRTIRSHGWLIGLMAGGLVAPWIVR